MRLKSLISIATLLLTLSACGPTKEEKAQEMAANHLKGILYHFDSYEPLQTSVDSSFVSLTTDKEAISLTLDMLKLFQSMQKYTDEIKQSERMLEIWSPGKYSSAHIIGEYNRAKEERDINQRLLEKTKERVINQFAKIKKRQSVLNEGDFDGWMVCHKFKSLNGTGTVSLFNEFVFFCDTDFNEKSAYPKDDYDAIKKIMIIISSSDDVYDMIENIQGEIF